MKRDIRMSQIYPHSPERVWFALTDREAISEWLMENDFEPKLGHRFTFRTKPGPGFDGIVNCEVLAVDEPRRLSYSWRGGPINTIVTFTLEPAGDGTKLSMEQTGFVGIKSLLVSFILERGFRKIYGELLPAVLDRIARGGKSASASSDCETPDDLADRAIIGVLKVMDRGEKGSHR